jgi:uncharacterized protein (UPF0335 family)
MPALIEGAPQAHFDLFRVPFTTRPSVLWMTGEGKRFALTLRPRLPTTGLQQEKCVMPASNATEEQEQVSVRFAKDQLKAFVERIEKLEEEKKAISDDIRDVYAESKANGFDVKALRQIVKLRKIEPTEREEQDAILETYMHALGMLKP